MGAGRADRAGYRVVFGAKRRSRDDYALIHQLLLRLLVYGSRAETRSADQPTNRSSLLIKDRDLSGKLGQGTCFVYLSVCVCFCLSVHFEAIFGDLTEDFSLSELLTINEQTWTKFINGCIATAASSLSVFFASSNDPVTETNCQGLAPSLAWQIFLKNAPFGPGESYEGSSGNPEVWEKNFFLAASPAYCKLIKSGWFVTSRQVTLSVDFLWAAGFALATLSVPTLCCSIGNKECGTSLI